jgi:pyruvate/2-oxoglutarate dehydrogenase complex dihydrolipoamide dehydrogenase (E3) component
MRAATEREYDLVVIGGGAGGIAAARIGRHRGATTLMIQDGPIGGDCTFTGCVPSKAVIAAAAAGASFTEAMDRADRAIEVIAATENADVLRSEGIDVIDGRASFRSPHTVDVEGTSIRGRRFVLATGAAPAVPPIEGLQELDHLTNETVFGLRQAPGRLTVLGAGAVGCELAQAMARLGVEVTLVEALDRVLSREEPEASAVVLAALRADGVDVRLGSRVTRVAAIGSTGGAHVEFGEGSTVEADRVLVAAGRRPVTDGLALEQAGVELTDQGHIATDDRLRTSRRHIYAAGDVNGKLLFTHAAFEMGRRAADHALTGRWRHRPFRTKWVPWVTFTDPEVGRVGMTEAQAAEHGGRVAYLPMTEMDRAITEGRTEGFVKLIAGPRRLTRNVGGGRLLGATVTAARGGELIHGPTLAMRAGLFPARLALTTHAYPTWSMAIQKAASQFFIEMEGRVARPAEADS